MGQKRKSIEILNRIFEESEKVKLSPAEIDKSLIDLGSDPEIVVKKGMSKIRKWLGSDLENQSLENKETGRVMLNPETTSYPMAASKSDPEDLDEKLKTKKLTDENQ